MESIGLRKAQLELLKVLDLIFIPRPVSLKSCAYAVITSLVLLMITSWFDFSINYIAPIFPILLLFAFYFRILHGLRCMYPGMARRWFCRRLSLPRDADWLSVRRSWQKMRMIDLHHGFGLPIHSTNDDLHTHMAGIEI